jgi:hypothetical protein
MEAVLEDGALIFDASCVFDHLVPYPRIEIGIGDIDQDVQDEEGKGRDENDPLDNRKIPPEDRVDCELANAGQAKTCSVRKAPPRSIPNCRPMLVITGMTAFFRACL